MNHNERLLREAEAAKLFTAGTKLLQEAQMKTETPTRVSFCIDHDRPIQVISFGDLHLGSLNTDTDEVEKMVEYILNTPDVYVILTGDEIEGRKEAYLSTNGITTVGSAEQHIETFRTTVFEPLNRANRIMAMVTDYWGHNGWAQDSATTNPWKSILRDADVNLVAQGGTVDVQFASGKIVPIQVYHNSPGRSKFDPVHGSRNAQQNRDAGTREGTVFSAHTHRAGIEQSHQATSVLEKVRQQVGLVSDDPSLVFVQNGAFKSVNAELPQDPFGKRLGLPLADLGGQSIEVFPASDGKILRYPTLLSEQGAVVHTAMTLLNDLERQGLTDEMKERIATELEERPEVKFAREFSQMGAAGQYDVVWYDINTKLPIRVEFAQNIRYGSGEKGIAKYEDHLTSVVATNPHVFVALLRNVVDSSVARSSLRDGVLDEIISAHVPYEEQLLLLMKDSSLSQAAWGRDIGKGDNLESYALNPVRLLASELAIPAVHNKSALAISLGSHGEMLHRPTYTTLLLDKLGNNMSTEKPTFGHIRQYDKEVYKPGIVAGGHAPGSGFSTRFEPSNQETNAPIAVAPGWWSEFDAMGKGNKSPGAEPGASVILMPGNNREKYMAFGTADAQQSVELHNALKLYVGLAEMGLLGAVSSWMSLASNRLQ